MVQQVFDEAVTRISQLIAGRVPNLDLVLAHLVPGRLSVDMEIDDVRGLHQVLREFITAALEVLGFYVGDILAIFVGLKQQEFLLVVRIPEPFEVQATVLGAAGLGVPIDFFEEIVGVFGLDVELNVNENHGSILRGDNYARRRRRARSLPLLRARILVSLKAHR